MNCHIMTNYRRINMRGNTACDINGKMQLSNLINVPTLIQLKRYEMHRHVTAKFNMTMLRSTSQPGGEPKLDGQRVGVSSIRKLCYVLLGPSVRAPL